MSSEDYLVRVKAFLTANRIQFVSDATLASQHYINTLPFVDPRSLIFAPSIDVEDVARDAILLKLAGILDPSPAEIEQVHNAFMRAKQSLSEDFVKLYMLEVKKK